MAFKSLYDSLLEQGLITPDPPPAASEPAPDVVSLTGKAFAKAVLRSEEFRLYIIEGLMERDLPPAVLCRLMDHGWGKPVEHLKVTNTSNTFEALTVDQLEARAMHLAEMARRLRQGDGDTRDEQVH